jgi:hypothetical protein
MYRAESSPPVVAFLQPAPKSAEPKPQPSLLPLTVPQPSAGQLATPEPSVERVEPRVAPESLPINAMLVDIRPPAGELPPNAAAAMLAPQVQPAVGGCNSRGWPGMACLWQAPAVCHRPLYFEQPNVERYGYSIGFAQPVLSGAHFFGSVIALPYFVGARRPNECIYTLGYDRPGTPTPFRAPLPPLSLRGAAMQGAFVTGAVFAIP